MNSLKSTVTYTVGYGPNRPSGIGTLVLEDEQLKLSSDNSLLFDVPICEVKRVKVQLGIIVVYLQNKTYGMTLSADGKADEQFDTEVSAWKQAFKQSRVKSTGLGRAILVYGLGTIVVLFVLDAIISTIAH